MITLYKYLTRPKTLFYCIQKSPRDVDKAVKIKLPLYKIRCMPSPPEPIKSIIILYIKYYTKNQKVWLCG